MLSILRSIGARTVTTVILLPGLACDEALWRDQLPALRDRGHRVMVSDAHQRHATLPEMAQALLAEHDGPLVLVGSSMGGMLAQHVHRAARERIAALALLSTTARPDTPELLKLRSDAIVEFEAGRAEIVLYANAMFAFHPDHTDRARVDDYVRQILGIGAEQLIAQNRAVMARADMRPWLADIRCPLLVACGDCDLLTPLEHSREIADAVPHAQLEVVPQAGHLVTWEQPERVNALLLQWLDRVLPKPLA
jgi:pimeloyl-ACP methyl ester carboxylesterase